MGYGVPDSGVDFYYASPEEAYLLLKNDKAIFVDSRDEDDYKTSRLHTSFHLAANSLIMKSPAVDQALVQHLIDMVNSGKTLICLSDACVKGNVNRGHVSRCRHIAQYLVELGADRGRILRMSGGINAWKRLRLDGVIGELRPMYAGEIQNWDFGIHREEEEEEPELPASAGHLRGGYAVSQPVRLKGLVSRADLNGKEAVVKDYDQEAGRWELELDGEKIRCKPECLEALEKKEVEDVEVCCGGVVADGERMTCKVRWVAPRAPDAITCYRSLRPELFKKPTRDGEKIIKISRPVSSIVRTTGQTFVGASGGLWAELDVNAGEKKGWIYIKGPGFGASSCKITSEYLRS